MTSLSPKVTLPIAVLIVAGLATAAMIAARPSVATRKAAKPLPLVHVQRATAGSVQLLVETQGSVAPRTESELVAEVSGRITWVSPSLAAGRFLVPGETLLRIDSSDYEVAIERAQAMLARAESERELTRTSLDRLRRLVENGVTSTANLDEAVHLEKKAKAAWREASAAVTQAQRELARTEVVSPFAGRVREKRVGVGQFVSRGAPVARVYAVDYAEVRLPIADDDAAFVDLPIDYRDHSGETPSSEVLLRGRFAGTEYTWKGRIVRTEGEIDPHTRMIHAVARVDDPYGRGEDPERPPLAVGLFVTAEIAGRLSMAAVWQMPVTSKT